MPTRGRYVAGHHSSIVDQRGKGARGIGEKLNEGTLIFPFPFFIPLLPSSPIPFTLFPVPLLTS